MTSIVLISLYHELKLRCTAAGQQPWIDKLACVTRPTFRNDLVTIAAFGYLWIICNPLANVLKRSWSRRNKRTWCCASLGNPAKILVLEKRQYKCIARRIDFSCPGDLILTRNKSTIGQRKHLVILVTVTVAILRIQSMKPWAPEIKIWVNSVDVSSFKQHILKRYYRKCWHYWVSIYSAVSVGHQCGCGRTLTAGCSSVRFLKMRPTDVV